MAVILPAHFLGPEDQPRLDREAEAPRYGGAMTVVVWTVGLVVSWGLVVLAGWWLVSLWRTVVVDGATPT